MQRKQVSLDLGTPALSPDVQRAGQYNVAVPPTPKTNSALQLAQALRVAPQIIGQTNNIAKTMGAEAAALQKKNSKGILGYNKAYQRGLVKRWFGMNKESIKERFKRVAGRTNLPTGATEQERMAAVDEFVANLDEERNMFNQELQDMFGGDAHREEAIQVLSSTFVDQFYNESMALYNENLEQQTEMFISADASSLIENKEDVDGNPVPMSTRVNRALDYALNQYKLLGIAPKDRSKKTRGIVISEVAVLIEEGKLKEASLLLAEAKKYKIVGNATLFGSAEGKREILRLSSAIDDAILETEVNIDGEADVAEEAYDTVLNAYLSPSMKLDEKLLATKQFLIANGTPEEDVEELVNSTFSDTMSSREMHDTLRDLTTRRKLKPSSDKEATLMGRIQDNFRDTLEKETFIRVPAGTIGQKDADDYELVLRDFIRQNPDASPTSALFPKSVNGKVMDRSNPLVETAIANAQEEGKWRTDKQSLFKHFNSKTITAITSSTDPFNFGDDSISAAGSFQAKLRSEAPDLWLQSGEDVDVFNKLLDNRSAKIVEELQEEKQRKDYIGKRYKDYVNTLAGKNKITNKASEEAKGGIIFGKTYETLLPEVVAAASNVKSDEWGTSPIFQKGIEERAEISRITNDIDRKILTKGSLVTYGFPTLESFDDGLMVLHNLSYADIPLGEEILRSAQAASIAFEAEANGTAADEQLKLISAWEDKGFKSSDELNSLINAQLNYIKYLF